MKLQNTTPASWSASSNRCGATFVCMHKEGLRCHVRVLSNVAAITYLSDALQHFLAGHPTINGNLEVRTSLERWRERGTTSAYRHTADVGALETLPVDIDRLALIVSREHAVADRRIVALT
jgi:DNA-binding transcriptional LysR family regulator